MELLDRYLRAVEFWLPSEQRGDVIEELSDDLRSEIEQRRVETGHAPSDDEVAAILKERGHPLLVAGRYLPQQYLIGPAVLPLYCFVLRVVLLWILVPVFVLVIAPSAVIGGAGPVGVLIATVLGLLQAALYTVGIVTIAFGLIERFGLVRGLYARWDPRKLPALPVSRAARTQPVGATIFALACRVVFTTWWLTILWTGTIYKDSTLIVALAEVWHALFWPILALSLVGVVTDAAALYAPSSQRTRSMVRIATDCASLAVVFLLMRAGVWIDVGGSDATTTAAGALREWLNLLTLVCIGGAGLMAVAEAIVSAVSLRRASRPPRPTMLAA
jgi:hypothetical protein